MPQWLLWVLAFPTIGSIVFAVGLVAVLELRSLRWRRRQRKRDRCVVLELRPRDDHSPL